ncbi:MAG: hypothetical protein AAF267_07560 [Deinococcota bacterium]
MKRHHIIIGLLLSFASLASAQNFRGLNWNLNKDQVLTQEIGFNFVGEVDSISEAGIDVIFAGELADLDTRLIYFFDGDGLLYRVAYGFTEVRPGMDTYLADFERIKNILEASYGPPAVTDTWQSEGYFSHTWETVDTIMIHALLRTETGVGHAIDLVKK